MASYQNRRQINRPVPKLNVDSAFLVYIWNVPLNITGRELKKQTEHKYGGVKFVETFEAWKLQRTGRFVIEFGNFAASEDFVGDLVENRFSLLSRTPVEYQHIAHGNRRKFFEMIFRHTDIDLLACSGNPPSQDWMRSRPRGVVGSTSFLFHPYTRGNDSRTAVRRPTAHSYDDDIYTFPNGSTGGNRTPQNGNGRCSRNWHW